MSVLYLKQMQKKAFESRCLTRTFYQLLRTVEIFSGVPAMHRIERKTTYKIQSAKTHPSASLTTKLLPYSNSASTYACRFCEVPLDK